MPHILLIHGLGLSTAVFDGIFADKGFTSKAYVVSVLPLLASHLFDIRLVRLGTTRGAMAEVQSPRVSRVIRLPCMPQTIPPSPRNLASATPYLSAGVLEVSVPSCLDTINSDGGNLIKGVIASDILEHITPNPLAGIVYLNSFPALFNVADLNTQLVRDLLPGLTSQNNVTLSKASTVSFTEALFADSATVPFPILTSWIGQSTLQPPNQTAFVLTRPQNTTNLVAAGQAGLPVLFLFGRGDRVLDGEKNLEFLGTWFTNITVNWINHGSHASFYDNQTYVEHALLDFADFVHDH